MYSWLQLNAPGDLLAGLTAQLSPDYSPRYVANRLDGVMSSGVKGVLIERNYIDKDYRSTYYNYYSKKGQRYKLDCVRLHFFDQTVTFDPTAFRLRSPDGRLTDHYFGYMVLRPTGIATIGRSVVSPDVRSGACKYIITARHKVHLLGYKLEVEGFPSMDQHVDISVCAHAACWSILRHYSERYSVYRELLTHDITTMAQEFDPGGLVPSFGLDITHAERVFQAAGTFPVHVAKSMPDDAPFYRQLVAYIDSGFPLFAAMDKRQHAVVLAGYSWASPSVTRPPGARYSLDEIEALAVVDDNYLPYLSIGRSGATPPSYAADDIDAFIVPLPEKIYYPADAVDKLSPTLYKLKSAIGFPKENESVIRYFVTTGSAFRKFVRDRESEYDPKLLEVIMSLPFAQFVWVIEFATVSDWDASTVSTRAVVDATASYRETFPLWLIYDRNSALVFDRSRVPSDVRSLGLTTPGHTGYSRMIQNLRPTQAKP